MTHIVRSHSGRLDVERWHDAAGATSLVLLVIGLHAPAAYAGTLLVGIAGLSIVTFRATLGKLSARLALGIFAGVILSWSVLGTRFDALSGLQRYRQVVDLLLGVGLMQRVVGRSDLRSLIRSVVDGVHPAWRRAAISLASAALAFPLSLATVPLVIAVIAPSVTPREAAAAASMRAVTLTMLLAPTTLASAAISSTLPHLDPSAVLKLGLPLFMLGFLVTCRGRLEAPEQAARRGPWVAPLLLGVGFATAFAACIASGSGVPAAVTFSGGAVFVGEQLLALRRPSTALNDVGIVARSSFAEILLLLACGLLAAFVTSISGWPPLAASIRWLWGGPAIAAVWVTIVLPMLSMTGIHPMIMFSLINPVVDNGLLGSRPCQYLAWAALFAYGQLLSPASINAILAASTLGVSPADTSYRLHRRYVVAMAVSTYGYLQLLRWSGL